MISSWSAIPELALPEIPHPSKLPAAQQQRLQRAALALDDAYQALQRGGLNPVGEVLRGQGTFYEMNHYPEDDVYDNRSHAQYYYHAHRGDEHGHFHTFVRRGGMPEAMQPASGFRRSEPLPSRDDELAHLICISMDADGEPIGLFAVNRWVTDESWYSAADTINLLDRFHIDHAFPNLALNQWLTQFVRLYRPQIEMLLIHRDEVIAAWRRRFPERDVLEDRKLEITGYLPIDPSGWAQHVCETAQNAPETAQS